MTYTASQINTNREYINSECIRIQKTCNSSVLVAGVIFHWDPFCNKLETRVAYFEDNIEAQFWKEEKEAVYKKMNIDYVSYMIFPILEVK